MDMHPASRAQLEEAGFEALQRLHHWIARRPVRTEKRLGTVRLNLSDAQDVLRHLAHVQAFAWRDWPTSAPLDGAPGEQRPAWLDRPVASFA